MRVGVHGRLHMRKDVHKKNSRMCLRILCTYSNAYAHTESDSVDTFTFISTDTRDEALSHKYTHARSHTHTRAHARAHTHTHTHTRTHTFTHRDRERTIRYKIFTAKKLLALCLTDSLLKRLQWQRYLLICFLSSVSETAFEGHFLCGNSWAYSCISITRTYTNAC